MEKKYLNDSGLMRFWGKIKSYIKSVSDALQGQINDKQEQITANKSAQDTKNASLDENMKKLNTRDDQITETLKNISATGGASVASAVTYDNTTSQLTSANIQGAVDELQGAKIDKTSILQELGEAEDKVMSQKAVSDKLSDLSFFSAEDFEIGDISIANGNPTEGSATLRTKEYIVCTETLPFEISENIKNSYGYFYDIEKKYLGYEVLGTKFYPKKGSSFLKIVLPSSYGTVYKNDAVLIHRNSATQAANAVLKKIEIEKEKLDASIPYYLNNILGKEDFEIGDISIANGNPTEGSATLRTKEYIACSDEQSFFVSVPTQKAGYAYYYDDAKGFLGYEEIPNKQALLPKKGSSFLKIVLPSSYGTVYKNDVTCSVYYGYINLMRRNKLRNISEDFEIGDISIANGNPTEGSATLRTKEYIACSDEQSFFVSVPTQKAGYAYYYDDAKGFLGYEEIPNKQALLPKKGSSFLKIVLPSSYGTVYKNDVKIATSFYRRVLVVSKYADSDYNTVSKAVDEARSGDIVFVRKGIYDNEIVDASKKTISIIGEGKNGTIIMGDGDYETPPLQMASGYLCNLTIRSYGKKQTAAGRFAYAMHSDYDILANNTFNINNCSFETEAGFGAVGFGLRGGCFVSFTNCNFTGKKLSFFLNETVTKKGYNQASGIQNIDFSNCRFVCNGDGTERHNIGNVMAVFEGYKSKDSKVLLTLTGNVFVHNEVQPILQFTLSPASYWDDGNNVGNIIINSNGDTMTNWYLTSSSCNNNIDELNRCKKGTINNLNSK